MAEKLVRTTCHDVPPAALRRAVEAAGFAPTSAEWTPLPRGRTNLLWRVSGGDPEIVVKLFRPEAATPLFRNDPAAEARILEHLSGTGLAPRLLAQVDSPVGPCVLYHHVAGQSWTENTGPVARMLRHLHDQPAPPELPMAPDGSAALTRATRHLLSLCAPGHLRDRIADHQPVAPEVPASGLRRLLHGDPVPGNIVVTPDAPILIDWQCPQIGDPVTDLAFFLSPAMQLLYRGRVLEEGEVWTMLETYGDAQTTARLRALAPWYHWRMAAYCLWRGAGRDPAQTAALEAEFAALNRA